MTERSPSTPKPSALRASLRKRLLKILKIGGILLICVVDFGKRLIFDSLPVIPVPAHPPSALFSPLSFFMSLGPFGKNLTFEWVLGLIIFSIYLFYKKARYPRSSRLVMLLMWMSPMVVLTTSNFLGLKLATGLGLLSFSAFPILGMLWLGMRPPFVPEDAKAEEKKAA